MSAPQPVLWAAPGTGPRVGGHRGASAVAPENTMASFRAAAASGTDYVELDVQLSLDGELMVYHDETLERTSDGHGRLDRMPAAEPERLDAGTWFGPRLSICSFEAAELRGAAAVAPGVARILIVDRDDRGADLMAAARDAESSGVNVPWDWLDTGTVARLHAAGLLVAGGTIELAALPRCLALGIDLVDSNDPGPIVTALRSIGVKEQ